MCIGRVQEGTMASREIDPDNETLWRVPPRRMPMETLRDSLLQISGALKLERPAGHSDCRQWRQGQYRTNTQPAEH